MDEPYILIAEDDADDRFLLKSAFVENAFPEQLHFVENGLELLDFLGALSKEESEKQAFPKMILLDLNMPRKDGRETLKEIKLHTLWRKIPVYIFSTTQNELEMRRCSELGADQYLTKPTSYEQMIQMVAGLRRNWMQAAGL